MTTGRKQVLVIFAEYRDQVKQYPMPANMAWNYIARNNFELEDYPCFASWLCKKLCEYINKTGMFEVTKYSEAVNRALDSGNRVPNEIFYNCVRDMSILVTYVYNFSSTSRMSIESYQQAPLYAAFEAIKPCIGFANQGKPHEHLREAFELAAIGLKTDPYDLMETYINENWD